MAQPFTFPPPPPPPPKRESPHNVNIPNSNLSHGGIRGRGSFRGGFSPSRGSASQGRDSGRNTGRGSHQSRGRQQQQHFYARGPFTNTTQEHIHEASNTHTTSPQLSFPQKRSYGTAFNTNNRSNNQRSRPLAPPAVPSFGLDLEGILAKKSEFQATSQSPPLKKGNLLGLTPVAGSNESESDDEGEESRLANTDTNLGLQFEYRGQTSLLRTPAEVVAWLAERRKRWPTQERVEIAKKEAEEKRKKYEAEKQARMEVAREAARLRQEQRVKERTERETAILKKKLLARQVAKTKGKQGISNEKEDASNGTKLVSKADRLREKALRAAKKLKTVEEALRKAEAASEKEKEGNGSDNDLEQLLAKVEEAAHENDTDSSVNNTDSDTSSIPEEPEDTSSSGSSSESDSESDSAPEVISSKRSGPERILPPIRTAPSSQSQTLCRNFAKSGRCKHGKRCRYLHERPEKRTKAGGQSTHRKSLYQVMVEKEHEEQPKKVLRAIIALGEKGLLDEPIHNEHNQM